MNASIISITLFTLGLIIVFSTVFSAISTFVLPRAARSNLNRLMFGILRRIFGVFLRFTNSYEQRDAVMAYFAPIGTLLLVPTWYVLIGLGFASMYWALGVGDVLTSLRLSGSSLLTLGFAIAEGALVNTLIFAEALIGLILVALLISYLPTMYSAFSRREQLVNMLDVRAGSPPSAVEMLLRYNRIHGLDRLTEYWKLWETWFADVEESHTTLPTLVFFRSPRSENSWVTAAGTVLDAAALTLSAVDIPYEASAALCIRSGFLCFRRIANYFDIPNPQNPRYPDSPISITREEFDAVLNKLTEAGVPVKTDRNQAWQDFAGWRVNYDRTLLVLCTTVMAPHTTWSSDRAPQLKMPPLVLKRKRNKS